MSFTLLPVADNSSVVVAIVGAASMWAAYDEGVDSNDGDATHVQFLSSSSVGDVRMADASPFSPSSALGLAVWLSMRRSGADIYSIDTGEIELPRMLVQARFFNSGRTVTLGQLDVSSKSSYGTYLLPLPNDIDPVLDGWDKIAVVLSRLDGLSSTVRVTALELRALDRVVGHQDAAQGLAAEVEELLSPMSVSIGQAPIAEVKESFLVCSTVRFVQSRQAEVEEVFSS